MQSLAVSLIFCSVTAFAEDSKKLFANILASKLKEHECTKTNFALYRS